MTGPSVVDDPVDDDIIEVVIGELEVEFVYGAEEVSTVDEAPTEGTDDDGPYGDALLELLDAVTGPSVVDDPIDRGTLEEPLVACVLEVELGYDTGEVSTLDDGPEDGEYVGGL